MTSAPLSTGGKFDATSPNRRKNSKRILSETSTTIKPTPDLERKSISKCGKNNRLLRAFLKQRNVLYVAKGRKR